MSKTDDERTWYLSLFAAGGWSTDRFPGIKKWDAHRNKLLKDGWLEEDSEYPGQYRITEKGVDRIRSTRYSHMLPRYQSAS